MASGENPVDFGALFDEHMADEFVRHSAEATMTTMVPDPVVLHVPTSIGGRGHEDVLRFYREFFVDALPPDFQVSSISRTIGEERLVDEIVVSFTHTCEAPIFLPGVPPTGAHVRVPTVVIVAFADNKVASEHIYWDQASVLVQVGLLDASTVPARGAEQARTLETGAIDNALLPDW
jgi:carboxymethylenebutenolidase